MVASERWLAMLRGEKTDRIPVIPVILGHCAKVMGKSDLGDFYTKPKFNIQAQILTRELYKYDQPPFIADPGYFTECWGGKHFSHIIQKWDHLFQYNQLQKCRKN